MTNADVASVEGFDPTRPCVTVGGEPVILTHILGRIVGVGETRWTLHGVSVFGDAEHNLVNTPAPAGDMAGEDDEFIDRMFVSPEFRNSGPSVLAWVYYDRLYNLAREGARREPAVVKPNSCSCGWAPQWIASQVEGAPRICANCGRDEAFAHTNGAGSGSEAVARMQAEIDRLKSRLEFETRCVRLLKAKVAAPPASVDAVEVVADAAARSEASHMREQSIQNARERNASERRHDTFLAEQAEVSEAIQRACDLLAERTYGNAARSPSHNARLVLEAALAAQHAPAALTTPLSTNPVCKDFIHTAAASAIIRADCAHDHVGDANDMIVTIRAEALEEAAKIAEKVRDAFLYDEYAMGPPDLSVAERLTCSTVIDAIRAAAKTEAPAMTAKVCAD